MQVPSFPLKIAATISEGGACIKKDSCRHRQQENENENNPSQLTSLKFVRTIGLVAGEFLSDITLVGFDFFETFIEQVIINIKLNRNALLIFNSPARPLLLNLLALLVEQYQVEGRCC